MGTENYRLGTKNHLLVTPQIWVRGVIDPCPVRLADHLRNWKRAELFLRDTVVYACDGAEAPVGEYDRLLLARQDIVLAHEYVDLASDPHLRQMHQASPKERVRAYLRGFPGGLVEGRLPASQLDTEPTFLTLLDPVFSLEACPSVESSLRNLPYVLVQRSMITALALLAEV